MFFFSTIISLLKHLIRKNMEDGVPGAKLASTSTQEMFNNYIDDINLKRKTYTSYKISTSGLPAFTKSSSKSPGEKRYEAWSRKISDKTKYDILKEDKHYNIWKPGFEAELAHQKLSRVIDPAFDPASLTCSFEKELWKEQEAYFWTADVPGPSSNRPIVGQLHSAVVVAVQNHW